jgi:hypothetical protein
MITFVVHVGYGKSGTSFLQQKVFSELDDDVLFLGKTSSNHLISDELDKLFYLVFPSLINPKHKNDIRARNSSLTIPLFADLLLKFMYESNKKIILLSHECILDYSGYNGELNQYLLKKLFLYMECKCERKIEFKVMVTIRNQGDILKSFYAFQYSYDLKDYVNTFEEFMTYGLANSHLINFGGYHYDKVINELQYLFGVENIGVFLYEKMGVDINQHVNEIVSFIGSSCRLNNLDKLCAVNATQTSEGHIVRNVRGMPDSYLKVMERFHPILNHLAHIPVFQVVKTLIEQKYGHVVVVKEYPSFTNDLEVMYKASNQRLSNMIDIDLVGYGYLC